MAEGFGDAAWISVRQELRSVRDGPKIEQRATAELTPTNFSTPDEFGI